VSLTLRLGAGEPLLGIPGLLTYGADGATGVATFPFRTFAMLSGLVAIVVVSRVVRPTASTTQSS
jgi:high affinity choline transporter 7